MSLIIAGDRSGTGKTTITLALLSFLRQKGATVQSFKVGPDYVDPMFHTHITGRPCRNLDPILTSPTYVKTCFAQQSQGADYAVIEGVMGLFDGVPFGEQGEQRQQGKQREQRERRVVDGELCQDYGSTAHIARLLNIPVVLVIDCSRLSGSVAAIAHGYRSLDPNINIMGVILNRVASDRHLDLLETALNDINIAILGVLRRQNDLTIPDRHLGLVPTHELPQLDTFLAKLAHLAETCFNWEQILPYLTPSPYDSFKFKKAKINEVRSSSLRSGSGEQKSEVPRSAPALANRSCFWNRDLYSAAKTFRLKKRGFRPNSFGKTSINIAIAFDKAFNFYYRDNLDILEGLGANLILWSPLKDKALPQDTVGLYLGGGFPEMFAEALSNNKPALNALKTAILQGMPTYAECGGLMYLCHHLIDFEQQSWPMVGILPTTAIMGKTLTLGYRQAIASESSLLLSPGDRVWGHEFHRSQLTINPSQPLFQLSSWQKNSPVYGEGWYRYNLHASYLHLHFGGCPQIPEKFLRHALDFSENLALH